MTAFTVSALNGFAMRKVGSGFCASEQHFGMAGYEDDGSFKLAQDLIDRLDA